MDVNLHYCFRTPCRTSGSRWECKAKRGAFCIKKARFCYHACDITLVISNISVLVKAEVSV